MVGVPARAARASPPDLPARLGGDVLARRLARLDAALAESERHRDQLAAANEELARTNLELRTVQVAMTDVLNLADERTHGRMRELIEDTGTELAQLLEEELERSRET